MNQMKEITDRQAYQHDINDKYEYMANLNNKYNYGRINMLMEKIHGCQVQED